MNQAPAGLLADDAARLADICRRPGVESLWVFGSAARGALRPDSDLDLIVGFGPKSPGGLMEMALLAEEIERTLGRRVDLVTRRNLDLDDNPRRRQAILAEARPVYAA